jgi:putative acetyltransferase
VRIPATELVGGGVHSSKSGAVPRRGGETTRPLNQPADALGVTIRRERPGDREAIAAVVAAAFGSKAEADLVDAIRSSPEYIAELSLVAESRGEVIGHVMVSFTELLDGSLRHRIFHLSPLAVSPSHQRQGVGSALVEAVIVGCERNGAPFVVLEGDPRYYSRLGFEPSAPHGITIDLPAWAPPEAAQIRVLGDYDRSIRGRVVYPPAFDAVADR